MNQGQKRMNNSGMALVAVLAVISILLVAALGLARKTGTLAMASAIDAERMVARERAMTGIHLAMALLAEDGAATKLDSVQEDWARPGALARAVEGLGIPNEKLTIDIRDERGKLPLNALIKKHPGRELNPEAFRVWENFFLEMTDDPAPILNSILDWMDHRDDEAVTGISGAESDYYLSLDPPYTCANGPFTHISELFLVKDVSPALFDSGPKGDAEQEETEPVVIPEETITVHGIDPEKSGKAFYSFSQRVNINTANETVIRALLPRDKIDLAKDLVSYRIEKTEDGEFINPLDRGWPDLMAGFSQEEKKSFEALIRYDTDLFRVRSKARENSTQTTVHALIRRTKDKLTDKWSCRILQVTKDN